MCIRNILYIFRLLMYKVDMHVYFQMNINKNVKGLSIQSGELCIIQIDYEDNDIRTVTNVEIQNLKVLGYN